MPGRKHGQCLDCATSRRPLSKNCALEILVSVLNAADVCSCLGCNNGRARQPVHSVGHRSWCDICFLADDQGDGAILKGDRKYCRILRCSHLLRPKSSKQGYCHRCFHIVSKEVLKHFPIKKLNTPLRLHMRHGLLVRVSLCKTCRKILTRSTNKTGLCKKCYWARQRCSVCDRQVSVRACGVDVCNSCYRAFQRRTETYDRLGIGNATGAAVRGEISLAGGKGNATLFAPPQVGFI